jgi:hypothetical protein
VLSDVSKTASAKRSLTTVVNECNGDVTPTIAIPVAQAQQFFDATLYLRNSAVKGSEHATRMAWESPASNNRQRVTRVTGFASVSVIALNVSILYWRTPKLQRKRRPATSAFYVGVGLFVLSFFLPAIRDLNLSDRGVPGWGCALMAFFGLNNEQVNGLAVFGGLINPIAIAYIVLRIFDRAPDGRFFLAGAILAFIPLTWLSLIMMHLGILIGHVAWIAALLLIVNWKDFRSRRQ